MNDQPPRARHLPQRMVLDDPGLHARLLELTLHPESDMTYFLSKPIGGFAVAILREVAGSVVGWAALYGAWRTKLYADVFVDPAHRGRGHGRVLVQEVLSLNAGRILFSDVPFFRHVAPDLAPRSGDGVPLLVAIQVSGEGVSP